MRAGICHCGRRAQGAPSEYPDVCNQWPLCEQGPVDSSGWALQPCDACNAEPGEPCRPGCLGYAIEHDGLVGTEPCS